MIIKKILVNLVGVLYGMNTSLYIVVFLQNIEIDSVLVVWCLRS